MTKKNIKILIFSLIFIGAFLLAGRVSAATLSIQPSQDEYAIGETFIVEVHLKGEGEIVNAVKATITYPSDLLEVTELSKGGSFLSLWAQEPANESSGGVISLAGGIPNGSYVVDGRVLAITFRTIAPGGAEIAFDQNQTGVYLNDGHGTPANLTLKSGIFNIADRTNVKITSPTHPDEEAWYQNKTFTVNWSPKEGAKYSYLLTNDPDKAPDEVQEFAEGVVTFKDLPDGISYFILNEQLPGKSWQIVGKRRAMVDTVLPSPIETIVSRDRTLYDGKYFLIFSAVDRTSGVDHYDIIEDGKKSSHAVSPYILSDQTRQEMIEIRAFDKAGNVRTAVLGDKRGSLEEERGFTIALLMFIGALILLLVFVLVRTRSKK
ncbi:MAG: cohesin domain-containing protein [Patescibacteria group bacterium]|jgi:hypothetical protein